MRFLGTFLIAMLASTALADDEAQRLARLDAAFEAWLDENGAPGVMAVRRGDRALAVFEHGISAQSEVELASVAKSITAICAAELVAADRMDWSDSFRDVVGQGPDIALSLLVTHTSGLVNDRTQQLMVNNAGVAGPHLSANILKFILERGGPKGPAGQFTYNNENYAMTALMIEAATGTPYDQVCAEMALAPAGVDAGTDGFLPAALPWGGWVMTPADYARFHQHWFGTKTDPGADPFSEVEGGVRYGLGSYFRQLDRGNTFWHFGALCIGGKSQHGSYAVTWFGDWTVFAAYERCVDWDEMFALDQAIAGAVFGALE